jgi:hypothetical protein
MQGRRDGDLRGPGRRGSEEPEGLDEDRRRPADPRVDAQIRPREVDVARAAVERHRQRAALAGQAPQPPGEEVHVPRLPPQLAVGDALEPDLLLEAHRLANGRVLGRGQRGRVDAPFLALPPPRLEGGRPEQAAHVVGPEGRTRRGHDR